MEKKTKTVLITEWENRRNNLLSELNFCVEHKFNF